MRLEQENDNLAHELVTTKVELHSKLAEVCWCGFIHTLCEMGTFDVFAQLVEAVREVEGSSPRPDQHSGS